MFFYKVIILYLFTTDENVIELWIVLNRIDSTNILKLKDDLIFPLTAFNLKNCVS